MSTAAPAFPFSTVLWVSLGGAIGTALRFGLTEAMRRLPAAGSLPWATLTVNVTGSLVLGAFLGWALDADVSPQVRAFVAIGVCGGFTTFSTFAFDSLALIQSGAVTRAATYAVLSVVLCVLATFAGYTLARG